MRLVRIFYLLQNYIEDVVHYLDTLPQSSHVAAPYFSQFISSDLVEKYIKKELLVKTDPRWSESGAQTPEEYELWAWSMCGMTCFKMILATIDKKYSNIGIVTLGQQAAKYQAYFISENDISPMHFAGFCKFAKQEYGLEARAFAPLSLLKIRREISYKNFIIVSVNPGIRYIDSRPQYRGGHLVLIVGYDDEKGGLYLNNPSGLQSNNSQKDVFVSYKDFKKFFAGRGVVIQRPH